MSIFPINLQNVLDKLFERLDQEKNAEERIKIQIQILRTIVTATNLTSAYICRWFPETSQTVVIVEFIGDEANNLERESDLGVYYTENPNSKLGEWLTNPDTTDKHIHLYDLPRADADRANYLQYGACSLYCVEIQVNDAMWAYLELWESRYHREFTDDEQAIFHYVAIKLGESITSNP